MDLKTLVNHSARLPTVPMVTQRVIASLHSDDVSLSEIAGLLEADPVLSAKLLRLANSAYFQLSGSIDSVEEAVQVLGLAMVRNLALSAGMAHAFVNTPGVDLRAFWTYSLFTASAARWLAQHHGDSSDVVFTLGLIHALGQLHMHSAAPAAMASLDQQQSLFSEERAQAETQALGFNFLNVSATLARRWNFPDSLVEPLEQIAQPLASSPFSPTAALVHMACWHVRCLLQATSEDQVRASYPEAVGQRLGLSVDWFIAPSDSDTEPLRMHIPSLPTLTHGLESLLY